MNENNDVMQMSENTFDYEPYAGFRAAIPLRNMCVLPKAIIHIDLSRKQSIATVEKAMATDATVFLVAQKDPNQTAGFSKEDLYEIGTLAVIRQIIKMPNHIVRIVIEAYERKILKHFKEEDFFQCIVGEDDRFLAAADILGDLKRCEAMRRQVLEMFQNYSLALEKKNTGIIKHISEEKNVSDVMDMVAAQIAAGFDKKQMLLEAIDIQDRFSVLTAIMQEEIEVYKIKNELTDNMKKKIDAHQREVILREQMKYIKSELGEGAEEAEDDIAVYKERLEKLNASKEVKTKINKCIKRLGKLSARSSESDTERTYIEAMLDMPWDKMSEDNEDIEKAEKILNEDHYGLEKIKERIVEYLAVRTLCEKKSAPIICLVGPPGTGKTSIAKSIARAMNREYVRICLGGVRDEAEIRGHRRTYVAAMPGRIADGLKQAKVKNPLMLLDEIDKMGNDRQGDTTSAMLEVLDGEQNEHFRDHFLEIPLDLSEVIFVATANDISKIEGPLRDRMEIIEVSSYTQTEKLHIAKEYLVKKQLKAHGLSKKQLALTDKALEKMIASYTKEAGVRNLERQIGTVCRKVAKEVVKDKSYKVKVSAKNLSQYLGCEKYLSEKTGKTAQVGIVRGLAWTSVGGVTLEIEVNDMPGKGELKLTGQLGDVMKESAMTALSYVRFVSQKYDIDPAYFEKHDLHIHIPEGATPKDGPSAGVTMTTAILSAVTGKKVRGDIAMTGEITLRGRVLPIGGLKEKLLAAKLAGVLTVCIPKENEKDLEEIDSEIKTGLNIIAVKNIDEIFEVAFV